LSDTGKVKATETRECPACGTSAADRELLTVPHAGRLLRAFGELDDNTRQSILNLLENIAADHRRPASLSPRRNP
jgi:hypothetical protein